MVNLREFLKDFPKDISNDLHDKNRSAYYDRELDVVKYLKKYNDETLRSLVNFVYFGRNPREYCSKKDFVLEGRSIKTWDRESLEIVFTDKGYHCIVKYIEKAIEYAQQDSEYHNCIGHSTENIHKKCETCHKNLQYVYDNPDLFEDME